MTREEAIDVLKHNYPSACFTELCEAVDIAIKALSAQPEIIRCRECKYGSPNGVYGCRLERYNFNDESVRMYGEDYCSYGERREQYEER